MKPRFIALFCASALTLSLAGCGGDTPNTHPTATPAPVATPAPTPAATPSPSPVPTSEVTPSPEPEPTPTPAAEPSAPAGDWLAVDADTTFGMADPDSCQLVVSQVKVGLNDLQVALTAPANADGLINFRDAAMRIPQTGVHYDGGTRFLAFQLKNTVLDTGSAVGAAGSDDWVFDFMSEYGLVESSLDAGALDGSNRFFKDVSLYCNGTDTFLSVTLSEQTGQYRVESGSLDAAGYAPYFRVVFRQA